MLSSHWAIRPESCPHAVTPHEKPAGGSAPPSPSPAGLASAPASATPPASAPSAAAAASAASAAAALGGATMPRASSSSLACSGWDQALGV